MNYRQKKLPILFGSLLIFLLFACNRATAQVSADSTARDSILLKQIEEQMQGNTQPAPPVQTRSSLNFNPDISVIGDFGASYDSRGKKNFNAYLNETEFSLQAVVDPYIRADFLSHSQEILKPANMGWV